MANRITMRTTKPPQKMQMYMKERFLYQLWDCGCRETGISEVDRFDNKVVLLVVSVAD